MIKALAFLASVSAHAEYATIKARFTFSEAVDATQYEMLCVTAADEMIPDWSGGILSKNGSVAFEMPTYKPFGCYLQKAVEQEVVADLSFVSSDGTTSFIYPLRNPQATRINFGEVKIDFSSATANVPVDSIIED